jgi:hypothetical protein
MVYEDEQPSSIKIPAGQEKVKLKFCRGGCHDLVHESSIDERNRRTAAPIAFIHQVELLVVFIILALGFFPGIAYRLVGV